MMSDFFPCKINPFYAYVNYRLYQLKKKNKTKQKQKQTKTKNKKPFTNSYIHYQIRILHATCNQVSTNKPSIEPVVLEITT